MNRRKEIGERIKVMRLSRGMSQLDLAKALNCGQSTVAMYETGKRTPDIETIDYISDVFNVPPYAIMYNESEIKNMVSVSPVERRLLAAYKTAEPHSQTIALQILENNQLAKKRHK